MLYLLKSAYGLLQDAEEAKTMKARGVFITCAQGILEQAIASIEDGIQQPLPEPEKKAAPKKPKLESPEYEIRVDNKKLVKIIASDGSEAPLDLPMEIDGQTTTYGAAIGRNFSSGRFI